MNRLIVASVLAAVAVGGIVPVAWGQKAGPTAAVESTDPNLVGWWKLDDLGSDKASDSSAWGRHGVLYGNPSWAAGCLDGALQVDGIDDYVDTRYAEDLHRWTVSAWVNSPRAPRAAWESGPVHREGNYQLNWDHYDAEFRGAVALRIGNTWYPARFGELSADRWYHLAATFDGTSLRAYVDGELVAVNPEAQGVPHTDPRTLKIGRHAAGPWFFLGMIDDVRIYNRALADAEIKSVMERNPLLASNPQPPYDACLDIRKLNALTWSAGRTAVMHDVYLSKSRAIMDIVDTTTPMYLGRYTDTSLSLAGLVQSTGRYFWRVDEVQADGTTIHKGVIWTFTASIYNVIDDFEGYTEEEGHRIEQTWIDGRVNGTGSRVSRASNTSAGGTVGARGKQSMVLTYDNTRSPFFSEIEREFAPAQDWTVDLVDTLSMSLKGDAAGQWQVADIGVDPPDHNRDHLYLTIEDSNGKIAGMDIPDRAGGNATVWTEWKTPLANFARVDLHRVKRMRISVDWCLGVGGETMSPPGTGRVYIDDIRVQKR